MSDTFSSIAGKVLLRVPRAGRLLCEDWVRNAFRRVVERRTWSWMVRMSQFVAPQAYSTGTAVVTQNSPYVTGYNTVWDVTMVGRQFRGGQGSPIYTIQAVHSTTNLELDLPWGGPSSNTVSGTGYNIYQCYFSPPQDFARFISLIDPFFNWQLHINFENQLIDRADAMRANSGNAYVVSFRDYFTSNVGTVSAPIQVAGVGSSPFVTGAYSGPIDAIFVVSISIGGIPGIATYQWWKTNTPYLVTTTPPSAITVSTPDDGSPQELQDGVFISWPTDLFFNQGDIFIIRATAHSNASISRFELWPHQQTSKVYPFMYSARPPDISDPNSTLPPTLNGDILMEMALAQGASWPGPSTDKPNPYYRLELADRHERRAEFLINEAERNDEEIYLSNTKYQELGGLPFAPIPAIGDANWLMTHDI